MKASSSASHRPTHDILAIASFSSQLLHGHNGIIYDIISQSQLFCPNKNFLGKYALYSYFMGYIDFSICYLDISVQ